MVSKHTGSKKKASEIRHIMIDKPKEVVLYNTIRFEFRKVLDRSGLMEELGGNEGKRLGLHGLRVGSITEMVKMGVPTHLVQQQARHANLGTTMGYVNAMESEKQKASGALLGKGMKRKANGSIIVRDELEPEDGEGELSFCLDNWDSDPHLLAVDDLNKRIDLLGLDWGRTPSEVGMDSNHRSLVEHQLAVRQLAANDLEQPAFEEDF